VSRHDDYDHDLKPHLDAPTGRSKLRKAGALGSATVVAGGSALGVLAALAGPSAAATFTVTQATDDGTGTTAGTLSWAIAQANANPDADVISFAPSVTTVTFTGSAEQVLITEEVAITGPGSEALTIDFADNCGLLFNSTSGTASLTVSGLTFANGFADNDCTERDDRAEETGGALFLYAYSAGPPAGAIVIDDVTFYSNYAQFYGGGLGVEGPFSSVTIQDSTFADNESKRGFLRKSGGGLFIERSLSVAIDNTAFTGNTATGEGGGAYVELSGPLTITNSTFEGNSGTEGGGAAIRVADDFTATIANSVFENNTSSSLGGGARFENGDIVIRNSTFSGNAAYIGGGIGGDTFLVMEQSTVTGNNATSSYYGGGGVSWAQAYFASFDIVMSTISGNTSAAGVANEMRAARLSTGTTSSITGSIVAGGAPGASITGQRYDPASDFPIVVSSSLIGPQETIDLTDNGGNTFDVTDPGLEALADNGGPTQTMALAEGSPAIDAGPDPVPAFPGNSYDQRGEPFGRVSGASVDIGAFEAQPDPVPTTTTTTTPEPTTSTTAAPEPSTIAPDPTTPTTSGEGSETASGTLPTTGASVAPLLAAGAALLASGGAASALAARRRRSGDISLGDSGLSDEA